MGGSASKNVSTMTVNAFSKQSVKNINSTDSSAQQNMGIFVDHTGGDVDIGNITNKQRTNVSAKGMLQSFSSQSAQQDMTQKLQQTAKSMTSGINLGNFSSAGNEMNTYMNASVDLSSDIENSCAASSDQTLSVNVSDTKGNVKIHDISNDQASKVFGQCIGKYVTNQSSIQKLKQAASQTATATTKGFSLFSLIFLLILVFILIPMFFVGSMIKLIIMVLLVIGCIAGIVIGTRMIIQYRTGKEETMVSYGFSKLITPDNGQVRCNAVKLNSSTAYKSPHEAETACKANKDAVAYDWHGLKLADDGSWTKMKTPVTTFYKSIDNTICKHMTDDSEKDNMKLVRMPKMKTLKSTDTKPVISANGEYRQGDCCIETDTATLFKAFDNSNGTFSWEQKKMFVTKRKSNDKKSDDYKTMINGFDSSKNTFTYLDYSVDDPKDSDGKDGDVEVKFAGKDKPYLNMYKKEKGTWKPSSLTVPGYAPNVPADSNGITMFNASGYKRISNKYSKGHQTTGIALLSGSIIIGLIGGLVMYAGRGKKGGNKVKVNMATMLGAQPRQSQMVQQPPLVQRQMTQQPRQPRQSQMVQQPPLTQQ